MPSLTDVPGIRVGHASDFDGITGCTVVLAEAGAVASVEVRGAAPGTRETDALDPGNLVQQVHGILLAGGSAFGLAAANGVVRYLEEHGVGYDVGVARVPMVPAAVLFDLAVGDPRARPDPSMGCKACEAASTDSVEEGSVGAGTGATVGKMLAIAGAMKGGVGSWSVTLRDGIVVGALAAVNALGDIIDERGEIIAGARAPDGTFVRTADALLRQAPLVGFGTNTTLAVIATNAALSQAHAWRVAVQGHAGLSRAIIPSHTLYDGDTVFVLATGQGPVSAQAPTEVDLIRIGEAAARVVAESVRRAVRTARGLGGVPSLADLTDRS
ncbi:MAG: P1 family peptidase [Armatimonadota bacterium]